MKKAGSALMSCMSARRRRSLRACVQAGVRGTLQISAMGADAQARSRYHPSKKAADDYLRQLPIASLIVQPTLIHGHGGASARLCATLATLP